ncbi:galactosylceramide sulfotransferase-like [Diadema setosum]|uniref:galactosylceramide sulfotransferase-like n=1 Tax=Diadema setosum TaxID=31175 RepID=UPI003B3B38B1
MDVNRRMRLTATPPVARIQVKPVGNHNKNIQYLLVFVLLLSVFIVMASQNMITLSVTFSSLDRPQRFPGRTLNLSFGKNDDTSDKSNSTKDLHAAIVSVNETHVARVEQSGDQLTCRPRRNIAFIKTHKTGSTTLASILNRFALNHVLSCLAYRGDPLRGHIRLDILHKGSSRRFLPPLGVKVGDYAHYRGYNVLTVHVRLQPKILDYFMAKGTKYITILREPSSHFESAFFYFRAAKSLFSKGDKQSNLIKFSKSPLTYWNKLPSMSSKKIYTRNGQIFDLTLDRRIHTNRKVVESIINYLSKKMSLVLIMEYMDESLLLLKKLMCWSYEDISYVVKNNRVRTSGMSNSVRSSLQSWNWADTLLYDHFNRTLWRKIAEYGPTFQEDLATFRSILSRDYDRCVAKQTRNPKMSRVVRTKLADNSTYCRNLAGSSYRLFHNVWMRQMHRTRH